MCCLNQTVTYCFSSCYWLNSVYSELKFSSTNFSLKACSSVCTCIQPCRRGLVSACGSRWLINLKCAILSVKMVHLVIKVPFVTIGKNFSRNLVLLHRYATSLCHFSCQYGRIVQSQPKIRQINKSTQHFWKGRDTVTTTHGLIYQTLLWLG